MDGAKTIKGAYTDAVITADEDLMLAYGRGDSDAFDALYEKHKSALYRYCRRHISDSGKVDEVYQDIWTSVIRSREQYRVTAKFTTWLYKIAHHKVIDYYRQLEVVEVCDEEEGQANVATIHESLEPSAVLANKQLGSILADCINTLPLAQRDAFLLKEQAGLSLEQIAEVCGTQRETIKSRLRYALNQLRGKLRERL